MILMWHHPKYYQELAKIRKQFEKEQADKRASEQAIQETVPHNDIEEANDQGSEQAREVLKSLQAYVKKTKKPI